MRLRAAVVAAVATLSLVGSAGSAAVPAAGTRNGPAHRGLPADHRARARRRALGLPHIARLIPWNRLHVNFAGNAPVTGISVSVRAAGALPSFPIDDVGWTDVRDG